MNQLMTIINENLNTARDLAIKAQELEKLECFEEALKSYEQAVAISPHPSFLRMLGICALRLGYEHKALKAFQLAVAAGLKNSKIDAILADLGQRLGTSLDKSTQPNKEMSPIYYDCVYSVSKENDHDDFKIYFELWDKIIEKIRKTNYQKILDLGCGPGIFAKILLDKLPYINYVGIDYSQVAIQLAQQSCPNSTFIETDAFKTPLLADHPYEIIIATEFLEHIEQDIELLKRLRSNTLFFGSVPNYYAIGHVRYFKTAAEVFDRYSACLKSLLVEEVPIGHGNVIYCISGVL
jgi:tetratricopeptide (TPR) repeat protein